VHPSYRRPADAILAESLLGLLTWINVRKISVLDVPGLLLERCSSFTTNVSKGLAAAVRNAPHTATGFCNLNIQPRELQPTQIVAGASACPLWAGLNRLENPIKILRLASSRSLCKGNQGLVHSIEKKT